jgi:hypothetical protein
MSGDSAESESVQVDNAFDTLPTWRWTTPGGFESLALLISVGTFVYLGGLWGGVAGGLLLLSWVVLPGIVTVAVGQFALIALLGESAGQIAILGEVALLSFLIATLAAEPTPALDVAVCLGVTAVLGGLTVGVWYLFGLLAAVVSLVCTFAIVSYLSHRYLLLRLGLLGGARQ